jgi:hypothetical protein
VQKSIYFVLGFKGKIFLNTIPPEKPPYLDLAPHTEK